MTTTNDRRDPPEVLAFLAARTMETTRALVALLEQPGVDRRDVARATMVLLAAALEHDDGTLRAWMAAQVPTVIARLRHLMASDDAEARAAAADLWVEHMASPSTTGGLCH